MKKIMSILLILMLLTIFPQGIVSLSTNAGSYGDLIYIISNGEIRIKSCIETVTEVVIPSTIEGYPVKSIGAGAFYACESLTTVTIPDGVTEIGDKAFFGCKRLISVDIPNSITSIGYEAFCNCETLKSIYIPAGITSIEDRAFYNCRSIKNIDIPDSVTSIGEMGFASCRGLRSITIPDSVTSIGERAFEDCWTLSSVTIPDSVTSIEAFVFSGCRTFKNITIPDSVTSIGEGAFYNTGYYNSLSNWSDNILYIGKWLIAAKPEETYESSVREGTVYIADYAFSGCSSLENITITDSVTSIGRCAFSGCSSLASISVAEGNSAYRSEGNCLIENETKTLIAGCWNSVIPTDGSVTSIGDGAFSNRTTLAGIDIPAGVTSIGCLAFYSCETLTSITVPSSVVKINDSAFNGCDALETVCYLGTEEGKLSILIDSENDNLFNAEWIYHTGNKHVYDDESDFDCNECGAVRIVGILNDFDGDREITVADALIALRIAVKIVECTENALEIGDTDNDGAITVADALAILRIAAKLS